MGSKLVLRLLSRFPFIVTLGGALIGWIAGSMLVADTALLRYTAVIPFLHWIAGAIGALLVVGYGVVRR